MQTSIVPASGHTTYLLLDEIYGSIWREIGEGDENDTTIVQWIIKGNSAA